MTRPTPLPPALRNAFFTMEDVVDHRINRNRLKAADIVSVARGVDGTGERLDASMSPDAAQDSEQPGTGDPFEHAARDAVLLRKVGGILSHRSAARCHGIPLPGWLEAVHGLELTLPGRRHTTIRPGFTAHRRPVPEAHVVTIRGIRLTSAERTWCDMASFLRLGQEQHLIAAGDFLVTPPWTPYGRDEPRTTVTALRQALREVGRFKGVRLARASLPRIRAGSDSPPETFLRLALVDAGLPEPQLQVRVDPDDRHTPSADLGYRQWRIAIQYDGAHHRTKEQQARDARRDAWFQAHGWMVIRVTVEDLQDGFRRVISAVRDRAAGLGDGR